MNQLNKKTKIIINTPPRTGSHFLLKQLLLNFKIKDTEIYKTHEPELFKKQYKQISILRDPTDSLISVCAMYRFFERIPLDTKLNQDAILNKNKHQVQMVSLSTHIEYLYDFLIELYDNFDNLLIFKFDNLINNTTDVLKTISNKYDIPMKENINISDDIFDNFDSKFLKTSKNIKHYSVIKDNINKHTEEIKKVYEIYNKCIEKLNNG